jgi:hypothetical protein
VAEGIVDAHQQRGLLRLCAVSRIECDVGRHADERAVEVYPQAGRLFVRSRRVAGGARRVAAGPLHRDVFRRLKNGAVKLPDFLS